MRSLTVLVVLAIGLTACGGSVDPRSPGGGSTTVTESEVQVTIRATTPAVTPVTNPMTSTTADPEIEQAAEELEEALGELESLLDDLESLLEDPVD